ncbi:MAG: hypothetical protein KGH72_02630 [Candidatus Micrarchaeota archaeon]|nr:hypothetical protein [Candidatus Micrarchaeota archaeon]
MVATDGWKRLQRDGYYPAWCRELIVYPEAHDVFRLGHDVVDGKQDAEGRIWVLPAECIPPAAFNRSGMALFVNPQRIIVNNGEVIVIPRVVTLAHPFIYDTHRPGRVDEWTRMPKFAHDHTLKRLRRRSAEAVRWLKRDGEEAGVRPLIRHASRTRVIRFTVHVTSNRDAELGVGFVRRKYVHGNGNRAASAGQDFLEPAA